jgi:hypothetical protein
VNKAGCRAGKQTAQAGRQAGTGQAGIQVDRTTGEWQLERRKKTERLRTDVKRSRRLRHTMTREDSGVVNQTGQTGRRTSSKGIS